MTENTDFFVGLAVDAENRGETDLAWWLRYERVNDEIALETDAATAVGKIGRRMANEDFIQKAEGHDAIH